MKVMALAFSSFAPPAIIHAMHSAETTMGTRHRSPNSQSNTNMTAR